MIVITGWRSQIATEFKSILPKGEAAVWGRAGGLPFPLTADRYLFCQGVLYPKPSHAQTDAEVEESVHVNYGAVARACNRILDLNDTARICIIGSESAYRGSYDGTYAKAKKALHDYVVRKRLKPAQQLVCISPSIIEDAGMTTRREDTENLDRRRADHPKRRFLTSVEVAKMAHFLLYGSDYVTGTVVRMHGGLPE